MTLFIEWQTGNHTISRNQLNQDTMLIGRSDNCAVHIKDRTISRHHAKLFLRDDQIYLRNINTSNNITQVNQYRLGPNQATRLKPGDMVKLGQVELMVNLPTYNDATLPRGVSLEPSIVMESQSMNQLAKQKSSAHSKGFTGQSLGKYELLELVGSGAMAEVYRARHAQMNRDVAVKILHPHLAQQEGFVNRFRREAHSMGQLQHPHILRVFDFDVINNTYYMVMDYLPGATLQAYLADKENLPVLEALTLTQQLASALAYAHQRNIVHRDIKPENVMFTEDDQQCVMLTDFGLARLLDQRLTLTGTTIGTPGYMSPEVAQGGKADERADIYSLGVMLYVMLTGQLPYDGTSPFTILQKQLNEPIPPPRQFNPDISEAVEALVLKALAKTVDQRFQSAAEFQQAIEMILDEAHHLSEPKPMADALPKQALNSPSSITKNEEGVSPWVALIALSGVLAMAVTTIGALLWFA